MNSAQIGALAASIGVPIVVAIFARVFPARTISSSGATLDDLRPQYEKWERRLGLLYLASCVPISLALWPCLRWLSSWHAALLPPADLTMTATPVYWLLVAMLLSMVCAAPVPTWAARRLLKDRYNEFERYEALKYRFDEAKVTGFLVSFVGVSSSIAIFLGLNWYVQITREEVIVKPLFSVHEQRHAVTEIESIRTAPKFVAPNGNVVLRREYTVAFVGGRALTTRWLPSDPDDEGKRRLITDLSAKSGVPIREVEIFRKGEL